jgi:uncharacterized protein (TIGR00730 family)
MDPGSDQAQLARACGTTIAALGWTVMTGGYEGAMGAVSRGARAAGGRVIGITTSVFPERVPNDALHEEWTEPDYLTRMSTLLRQGHAFVGLPGGLGTLSECLAATCLASIGQLQGPLILFREPWEPVFDAVAAVPEVGPELSKLVSWIEEPAQLRDALGEARSA